MAPHAEECPVPHELMINMVQAQKQITPHQTQPPKLMREPLRYSGTLDQFAKIDHTPAIGTEFPDLQLKDMLEDEAVLRDLAILVSERGVVFFRNQKMDTEQQKYLVGKLGELTGKPSTSGLHKHSLNHAKGGLAVDGKGDSDEKISVISSDMLRELFPYKWAKLRNLASDGWHSDISYEMVPSDYSILQLLEVPEEGSGGDTLWASGYEAYDRLSPPMQRLAEGLSAVHNDVKLASTVKAGGFGIAEERGSPLNTGFVFNATHPVVRTNPVTGWKSLYGAGRVLKDGWIEEVTTVESEMLKDYFLKVYVQNHDLQVRFKWGRNDVAIWDNRSCLHTATNDYDGKRFGNRAVSIGEMPYYDSASRSRREALGENRS